MCNEYHQSIMESICGFPLRRTVKFEASVGSVEIYSVLHSSVLRIRLEQSMIV